jgi:putative membrane protein
MLFAVVHGAAACRLRGILLFFLLCFAVGNLSENLSIRTGFPFGHFRFTDAMGPKLFDVPILLGLAYIGMGYVSWTLARLILGRHPARPSGWPAVIQPLLAAGIMTAWDLSMDPIWANLAHAWTWHDGGAYFGVPISNFFGWYVTDYAIYQLFALYLGKWPVRTPEFGASFWRAPVVFYAVSATGNLLVTAPPGLATITDAAGAHWRVSAILTAGRLVSVFLMGGFAALAWWRLGRD